MVTDTDEDSLFPFEQMDGDSDFVDDDNADNAIGNCNLGHNNFNNFKYTEYKSYEMGNDIDPENNYYSNIINDCEYYTEDQYRNLKMDGTFSIIHFNCRSLNKNFDNIKDYLEKFNKFSVIAFSETWMSDKKELNVEMEGYDLFKSNRNSNRAAGGVALYVSTDLNCSGVKSATNNIENIMECLTIELTIEKSKNILISCVYRNPDSCMDTFTNELDKMFCHLNNNKVHLVCGDLNVDLLNPHGKSKITAFVDSMYSNSLFPVITKPTRITKNTATLIDNIFINNIESRITAGLLINDISDHLPIFAIFHHLLKKETGSINNTYHLSRLRTHNAITALKEDLSRQLWNEVYETNDPNKSYESFLSIILELYNKHCPLRKTPNKLIKRQEKPWITKGIENACKKKNMLYKIFLKQRTEEAEARYKTYKNKLINIIRLNKKSHYHRQLEHHKGNIKATWNTLNNIIKKGACKGDLPTYFKKDDTVINTTKEISNEFNNFFVNVGPSLANQIIEPKEGWKDTPVKQNTQSIFIKNVDENEIISIVSKFKNKKSTDSSGIDMSIIKSIIDTIAAPFTHICNISFLTGIFPTQMKIAKVIPIHKSGDKHSFTNYRPISLLSQFSKIIEKLFATRLDSFVDKHQLLSNHQYGFRSGRSTSMAVMEVVEALSSGIENKEYAVGVFIDLKKAFDTIDHRILLQKMERYGIRGVASEWLKSYLQERQQYVHIKNTNSDTQKVTHGVPQGSVLGPKLFIIYINDICTALKSLKCVLFADDTSLYSTGKDLDQLINTVKGELEALKKWFDANKLSLNLSKTKYMIFSNKKINNDVKLTINDMEIERVYDIKFLGVIIDSKLNWKAHVGNVKSKISKTIAILYKIKDFINNNSLYTLYCSLILPYLNYCVEVWGNTYKTIIKPIVTIQKKAIRIINKADYLAATNPLFICKNALKFEDLVKINTAVFMYKVHNKTVPVCIQEQFKHRETQYDLRGTCVLEKKGARTKTQSRCISVIGVNLWNSLDKEQKLCTSIKRFKTLFKTKVLNRYKTIS